MTLENCIFCKIINGDIPSCRVYEDDKCIAIRDINPQAPVHILVIPKVHIEDIADCVAKDDNLAGQLMKAAVKVAGEQNLKGGFRLVTNTGDDARQSVKHLHIHILGGAELSEKMS